MKMNEHCCVIVLAFFCAPCFATRPECEVKFQKLERLSSKHQPGETRRLKTNETTCRDYCKRDSDCVALCWRSSDGRCQMVPNKITTGMTYDDCEAFEVLRTCEPGCSWVEKKQQLGGNVGSLVSRSKPLDECKAACLKKPSCEAISWKEGAECNIHPPWHYATNTNRDYISYTYVEFGADCRQTTNPGSTTDQTTQSDPDTEANTSTEDTKTDKTSPPTNGSPFGPQRVYVSCQTFAAWTALFIFYDFVANFPLV